MLQDLLLNRIRFRPNIHHAPPSHFTTDLWQILLTTWGDWLLDSPRTVSENVNAGWDTKLRFRERPDEDELIEN